jgi:polysaccharide pyruvyl transferase WcaK-like protein/glycosyltransferase involved in cell wall biosynthesis
VTDWTQRVRQARRWVAATAGEGLGAARRALPTERRGATIVLPPAAPGSLGDEAMVSVCVARLAAEGARRIGVVGFAGEARWPGVDGIEIANLEEYFTTGLVRGSTRAGLWLGGFERFWCLGADVLDGHHGVNAALRRIGLAAMAARAGLATTVLGFSFNERPAPEVVAALRALPSGVRLCARDVVSHERLVTTLGRPVDLVADTAFLLEPDAQDPSAVATEAWIAARRGPGATFLGVNVTLQPFRAEADLPAARLIELWTEALSTLLGANPELNVVLVPHDYRPSGGQASDDELGRQVAAALGRTGEGRVHAVRGRMTAAGAKHICSLLDAVVSGRMHLAIAALSQGIPAAGISYQGKFDGLYKLVGLEPLLLRPRDARNRGKLTELAADLLARREGLRARLAGQLSHARARACANFDPAAGSHASRQALVVTPEATHPTNKGNRVRILDMCDRFEELGYEVHVAHVERRPGDRGRAYARWGERYHPVPYRYPMTIRRRLVRRLRERLRGEAGFGLDDWYSKRSEDYLRRLASRGFDVVLVHYVHQSRALELFGPETLKVIDTHDAHTGRFQRAKEAGEPAVGYSTTAAQERRGLQRADVVIAIQDQERRFFASLTDRRVVTIGHRVAIVERGTEPAAPRILFFGSANRANLHGLRWFAAEVMPRVRSRLPGAVLVVAGAVCDAAGDTPIDERLGVVATPAEAYAAAAVVAVPIRFGTGLKIKTVEALGHGCAVVTTSAGAAGMEDGAGTAFRVADDPSSTAADLCELLVDPDARRRLSREAHAWALRWNEASERAFAEVFGVAS